MSAPDVHSQQDLAPAPIMNSTEFALGAGVFICWTLTAGLAGGAGWAIFEGLAETDDGSRYMFFGMGVIFALLGLLMLVGAISITRRWLKWKSEGRPYTYLKLARHPRSGERLEGVIELIESMSKILQPGAVVKVRVKCSLGLNKGGGKKSTAGESKLLFEREVDVSVRHVGLNRGIIDIDIDIPEGLPPTSNMKSEIKERLKLDAGSINWEKWTRASCGWSFFVLAPIKKPDKLEKIATFPVEFK